MRAPRRFRQPHEGTPALARDGAAANGALDLAPPASAALQADAELAALVPAGVALLRAADGVLLSVNPAWERLFGYTSGEAVGLHFSAVTVAPRGSPQRRVSEIVDALDRDGCWHGDVECVAKDGSTFWSATEVARHLTPEHGEAWIVLQTDVTASHADADERRRAAARWRSAFDAAPVGMAIIGADLRMTDVNARLCALTGYARDELIGTSLPTLLHPDDVAGDAELAARLRAGELDRYRVHERLIDNAGRTIPVEAWVTIVRAPDGEADHELAVIAER